MAANRDEFFDRPAARLGWWEPEAGKREFEAALHQAVEGRAGFDLTLPSDW